MIEGFDIKTEGIEDLMASLRRLGGRAGQRVITNATKAAERVVMKEVRRVAPVNSGWMRDHTKLHRPKMWEGVTWVGVRVPWPSWFLAKGIRSDVHTGWLSAAVKTAKPAAIKKFAENMRRGIDREMRK